MPQAFGGNATSSPPLFQRMTARAFGPHKRSNGLISRGLDGVKLVAQTVGTVQDVNHLGPGDGLGTEARSAGAAVHFRIGVGRMKDEKEHDADDCDKYRTTADCNRHQRDFLLRLGGGCDHLSGGDGGVVGATSAARFRPDRCLPPEGRVVQSAEVAVEPENGALTTVPPLCSDTKTWMSLPRS